MKEYETKNKKPLTELTEQSEQKNRKILTRIILASILCVAAYIAIIILGAYLFGEGAIFNIIVVISTILLVIAAFIITKIEAKTGYHACRHCGQKFVPTYIQAAIAPHIVYTRYLECPKCHKRSWAKKVLTKE